MHRYYIQYMQKISITFTIAQGASPWQEEDVDYFVYIKCNTHAYIGCDFDADIRCPYTHPYIACLAAAAGNNGDCSVVSAISATEQQRCWHRCCTKSIGAVLNNGVQAQVWTKRRARQGKGGAQPGPTWALLGRALMGPSEPW